MKFVTKYAYWVAIALLALGVIWTRTLMHAQPGLPVVPSTVVLQGINTTASGQRSLSISYVQAVRSDGSSVMLASGTPEYPDLTNRIIEFANGKFISIQDSRKLKSTQLRPPNARQVPRLAGHGCLIDNANEVSNGDEVISGYRAVSIKMRDMTRWFALDHGCAQIRTRIQWPNGGVSEKVLVSLQPGEPNPALFQVANDLKEVPPSVINTPPGKPCCGTEFSIADSEYYKHHVD